MVEHSQKSVFGSESSLPLLRDENGCMELDPKWKSDMLSDFFSE